MQSKHDEMRGSVPANVCQRAKRFAGGGALERGDLRLFEDCSELGGTLVSDAVVLQTVSEEQSRDQACQGALTERQTLRAAAHSRLVIIVFLRTAASAEAPWALIVLDLRLRARGG